MLYLFDIDGTLVDTGGAGLTALVEATREIFGHDGPELDLAGSTDLGIIANIHAHFEIEVTRERIDTYFQVYLDRLDWNLANGGHPGRVIAGATELLQHLAKKPDATLGLLTGNISGGAAAKMRHYGLSHYFSFGAYGSDHADRNQLGPIALERAALHAGRKFTADETWVIGDTPKDIACAHAVGARCLAVATGRFSVAELEACGADRVVASLDQALDLI
ncbi:HAD family hydrolase [Luteolibacter yonseiensis]|uniref:phosphoglycolate phosphatase n=1 Tax=Luteolibacter yonseiensis TaxID=1144680 RepID=A0A934R6Z0_9BACT|nr:HAD family hydrolase [Luteolibacter yonseiensis]MBK1818114.1 HAD family hydrolase [Luteolibacter yonseiensis]